MPMYHKPGKSDAVMRGALRFVVDRLGWSPRGLHLLEVRGRTSGKVQTVPVYPLDFEGARYLVAPRGETQWVRNMRAAGEGTLRVGKKTEPFTAQEISDAAKPPILRAYMNRWAMETGKEFGISKDAADADFARIAPDHPIFQLTPR